MKLGVLFSLVAMTSVSAAAQLKGDALPDEVGSWIRGYAVSLKSREGVVPSYYPGGTLMAEGILVESPAAAVVFTLEGFEGGNNYTQYVAVFWKRGGHYVYCCSQRGGGQGFRTVERVALSGGNVQLSGKENVPGTDPMCCPSKPFAAEMTVANSKLVESARTSNNRWNGP
jgi:hypothetical protein